MKEAIRQAKLAKGKGDYAIGAIVTDGKRIISRCGNRTRIDQNPLGHAEILAIFEATRKLKNRHLTEYILYTTHEPCPMCSALCVFTKLKGIVCGARIEDMSCYALKNPRGEFLWRTIDIAPETIIKKSNEKIEVIHDFMRSECVRLSHQ